LKLSGFQGDLATQGTFQLRYQKRGYFFSGQPNPKKAQTASAK
jgi:hypothetical protein